MAGEPKSFGIGNLVGNRFGGGDAAPANDTHTGASYASPAQGSHPIITEDVEIRGEITFTGRLEFNGRFEGTLDSGGELIVGEEALIKGSIHVETADIAGKIQGDVATTGRVRLRPEAIIHGDIKAGVVVVEEGAIVEGRITTSQPDRPAPDFSNIFTRLTRTEGSKRRPGATED
jgi:cytoskeletal protein CcmA (bactofilin family)